MRLGIFVNQEHINFIPFISILTAQTADVENINIHIINHKSKIKDFNFYDMNLVLNRYCLIRFDKLLNKKYLNKIFSLSCYHDHALVLFPSAAIKTEYMNSYVRDLALLLKDSKHSILNKECCLHNINYINASASNSVFLCYNDEDKYFIDFLKEHIYNSKKIYYDKRIYDINPNDNFIKYNGKDVCVLDKKLIVTWDPRLNKWKKLNKGAKELC